ncbi:Exonuclease [Nakaseomyces glabratus]|nr:Exonuclease [Nakaseomyces glabratus]
MNNWQHSFNNARPLDEHLHKPYLQYDGIEKHLTKFIFDDHANLVWTGDTYGCVSSYDVNFQPYVRQRAHIGGSPVKDLMSHSSGVLSLSSDSLHLQDRRGTTLLNLTNIDIAAFNDLQTMCYMSADQTSKVYCAGTDIGTGLSLIDLQRGTLETNIPYFSKVNFIKSSKKLAAIGKLSGSIDLFDPGSNQVIKSFISHSSCITSMDIQDYTLVTTGQSNGFYNTFADPFVNVYDLRTMRQLPPISFSKSTSMGTVGADFVQLHPVLPTIVMIASSSGAFDFVDMANPSLRTQFANPGNGIKCIRLSSNGDHLGVLESNDMFSTWKRPNSSVNFTNMPELLTYPSYPNDGPLANISINDYNYPLSTVGMPYYQEKLLSTWSTVIFRSPGTVPRDIDKILTDLKNSKKSKKLVADGVNFYPYSVAKYGHKDALQPYISLRDKRYQRSTGSVPDDVLITKSVDGELPPAFKNLPLVVTKYATDSFDFESVNKTPYCGLDNDVDNPFTNALIQLYRFIPEISNFLISTLKHEHFDSPLLTDMAYLFDMMRNTIDDICRTTNYQMSLNDVLEKNNLSLHTISESNMLQKINSLSLNDDGGKKQLSIRELNDFLLSELCEEEVKFIDQNFVLQHCYCCEFAVKTKGCMTYGQTSGSLYKPSITIGPNACTQKNGKVSYPHSILGYIEHGLKNSIVLNKKCEQCGIKENLEEDISIQELPPILSLSLEFDDNAMKLAKTTKNWLPKEFYASIMKNKPLVRGSVNDIRTNTMIYKYELHGYIARISDPDRGDHYVTFSRIYNEESKMFRWYLFNDYLVTEVDESIVYDLGKHWLKPEVVIYGDAEELRKPFNYLKDVEIDDSILYKDYFSAAIRDSIQKEYELLTRNEAPRPGSLIAIDAEFVTLKNEKYDIDCRGAKTVVQSKVSALARISVVRGNEEQFGVPFIDDYIIIEKNIDDYLTKFSGILPGDLDPKTSDKHLVPRNVAYRKIWLLMQLGCTFIGHGLQNDFKHINISVPKEQIRDTAVYFLQGKRYLSLRYLAYVLLDINVQEGNHDSIEDAYTALVLYKKYLELKSNGMMDQVLNKLYEEGRTTNYKVPLKL